MYVCMCVYVCDFSLIFIWSETWKINKLYCAMPTLSSVDERACSVVIDSDSVDPTTAGVPSAMSALIMLMSI